MNGARGNSGERCERWLLEVQDALRDELLPRWLARSAEGGVQEDALSQAAVLRGGASLFRAGIGGEAVLGIAAAAATGLQENFHDVDHGGWFERVGAGGVDEDKHCGTQAAVLLGLSEYVMASGAFEALELAVGTFEAVQVFLADNESGGYLASARRDWSMRPGGAGGAASVETEVLLLEAYLSLYESIGRDIYGRRAGELLRRVTGGAASGGAGAALNLVRVAVRAGSLLADFSGAPGPDEVRGLLGRAGVGDDGFAPEDVAGFEMSAVAGLLRGYSLTGDDSCLAASEALWAALDPVQSIGAKGAVGGMHQWVEVELELLKLSR